jgi:hypothetical protein
MSTAAELTQQAVIATHNESVQAITNLMKDPGVEQLTQLLNHYQVKLQPCLFQSAILALLVNLSMLRQLAAQNEPQPAPATPEATQVAPDAETALADDLSGSQGVA